MVTTCDFLAGRCLRLLLAVLAATAAWCWLPAGYAADAPNAAQETASRLEAVKQLILHSSAAKQIADSGDEAAMAKYQAAKESYERAVQAQARGDVQSAKRFLDEASRTMFEAVRLGKPEAATADKKRADFDKRLKSLRELLAAYERIRSEKQTDSGSAALDGSVKETIARATALREDGRIDEARTALDQAYASTKTALERLRNGDTMVRSLQFGSKEEEYRYERDRNDTHKILLTSLLDQSADRPELRKQAQPFVDHAGELRQQAESAATAGDYTKAIAVLEQSTGELVRAIRACGVYIPG